MSSLRRGDRGGAPVVEIRSALAALGLIDGQMTTS